MSLNMFFAFLTAFWLCQSSAGQLAPISDERLNSCYKQFPFLLDSLMQISDTDFADSKKSMVRKKAIQIEFNKKPVELRSCLEDIIQYAKDQHDDENAKYVVLRMSEVSSIVYQPKAKPNAELPGVAR